MKFQTSLSLVCLLLLTSCNNKVQNEFSDLSADSEVILTEREDWVIQIIEKEWETGNCETENQPCFEVMINYPQFQGDNSGIVEIVNEFIQTKVVQSISGYNFSDNDEKKKQDLDQIVQEIFIDFNQSLQDAPRMIANHWTIELNGEKSSETENTITVLLSEYSYLGGAHPNSYQTYLNFNKETGEIISLEDLVREKEIVLQIAEKRFREVYEIAPNRPLSDAGLFDNQLTLPENFAITKEGLLFFYNTYEIGPYATGTYEFIIPWEQLSGVEESRFSQSKYENQVFNLGKRQGATGNREFSCLV
ncbi:MAG: DUF3298 and DUF4163 domain-containing protein [Halothece sp. Uz-M2-17]|nr:DUF3298 and DUF4163 domain-containing protein [Halothece sp. Uz-M2-17]